jgi:26S proteasome regulatory subunit N11
MNEFEQQTLMSLNRPMWSNGFEIQSFVKRAREHIKRLRKMSQCVENYRRAIFKKESMDKQELVSRHVGKIDPQAYIRENANTLSEDGATQMIQLHLDASSFGDGGEQQRRASASGGKESPEFLK